MRSVLVRITLTFAVIAAGLTTARADESQQPDPAAAGDFSSPRSITGELTAAEVLRQYATRVYGKTRNYEQTARILELDSRTVKKYIDRKLLEELT